jgi:hypothetical protein
MANLLRPCAPTLPSPSPQPDPNPRPAPQAIWLELQEAVHAVDAMTTKTPSEAGSA